MRSEHYVGESASVGAGDGSHLVSVLSGLSDADAQLSGKIPHQCLIGSGIDMNLFLGKANREVGGMCRQLATGRFDGGHDFLFRRWRRSSAHLPRRQL